MEPEKKSRRTGSKIAKKTIEAAAYTHRNACGDDYGGVYMRAAASLLSQVNIPLTAMENEGIGAGGELMLHMPMTEGDRAEMQLRDTVKAPNMITATAQLDRLRLAEGAGALDIALDATDTIQPRNSFEKMLAHQMSAAHVLAMRMAGVASNWLYTADPNGSDLISRKQAAMVESARAATAATKLMQAYQQGLLALQRIRSGGQKVTVVHQHVQVAGGHVAVAGAVNQGEGDKGGE